MKLYKCTPKRSTYCDNYECIVLANDIEEVKKLIGQYNRNEFQEGVFEKNQGEVTIKELKQEKPKIISISNVGA